MTKIDIFSGFLGAGKTTLIKKLIEEAYKGEKVVLIENEFGEIGIDGGFLRDAGIEINEMNSGCICCSLVGDFGNALTKVMKEFNPDRILIEPSGVGKLSDIITAVQKIDDKNMVLNGFTTIVDAKKCKMYLKNFGEFYDNQVEHASAIVLSHTQDLSESKLNECLKLLKEHNDEATIITTPWDMITGAQILETMERKDTLNAALIQLAEEHEHEHGHHHDHEHKQEHGHKNEGCSCSHDHEEHEHHHDHEGCNCSHDHEEHEHHHDHEEHEHEGCSCSHDHEEHEHHHADEVFTSWGQETAHKYTTSKITEILNSLMNKTEYGNVLRAKGIVPNEDGGWIHFDYIPGEPDVRQGAAGVTGRLCVIGAEIDEEKLEILFELK